MWRKESFSSFLKSRVSYPALKTNQIVGAMNSSNKMAASFFQKLPGGITLLLTLENAKYFFGKKRMHLNQQGTLVVLYQNL